MTPRLTTLEQAALLSGKSVWQTRDIAGLRSIFMADGPHGIRKQLGSSDHLGLGASQPATCFPTAASVANSWDESLAEEVGRALGAEAAAQEVDVLLGPGLNIKRNPLAGRNFEYFSEDPFLAGKLAAGYVRGIQSQGVAATPKHFAVNSQELRRMASDSVVDERTLRELYLTAFEIVVREAHPRAIMSSYNQINGTYAHENRHLLTEILREEWGFDGAVITDWGGGNDPVAAVTAGGSIEMPAPGLDSARRIVAAIEAGALDPANLEARAAEIVRLVSEARAEAGAPVDAAAHHALARRVAAASVVLLRNEDAMLPLSDGTRVAVIGDMAKTPRYQGAGSSVVNPTQLDTPLNSIRATGLTLASYSPGYSRGAAPDAELVAEAVEAARGADVALLYLGLDEASESEGVDRAHIDLPEAQVRLLEAVAVANANVVVVLNAGAVVNLAWQDKARAIVHGYLGGQAGAGAVLDVITGAVNPSGKLAETYPLALEDVPSSGAFPATGRHSLYREGPFVGYRYFEAAGCPVRYPFGHGLSYTTFTYSDLVLSDDDAEFTLSNTGDAAGAEVAQLYVSLPGSAILRPDKELKGFTKVELAPGETRRVSIPFDAYTWRHFDVSSDRWAVETGQWRVQIGASSTDIRLTGDLRVEGEDTVSPFEVPAMRAALLRGITDEEFSALLGRDLPAEPTGPIQANDPVSSLARAKSPLARLAHRIMAGVKQRAEAKGQPNLDVAFTYNMPLRAIAKMTGGTVDMAMVDGIVTIVNGRFFAGFGATIRAFFRNRRANRRTAAQLTR